MSVVTDLHQALEAADAGAGGHIKHQKRYACAGRGVSGAGQTTAVPVKVWEENTMKLPLRSMHH